MNGSVVIDASLAVAWLVSDPFSARAIELARHWSYQGTITVAPHFVSAEVANAIYQRHLRGELSLQDAVSLIHNFLASSIEFVTPHGLFPRAMQLSSQLKQSTVYDSLYLALAQHIHS